MRRVIVLTALIPLALACKPRQDGSSLRADEAAAPAVAADASAASKQVEDACGKTPGSLFHKVVEGAVDYSAEAPPKAPADKPVQTAWFERAIYKEGVWHLSSPIRAKDHPTYVLGRKELTGEEFVVALGCGPLVASNVDKNMCGDGGACVASLTDASFDLPQAAGGVGGDTQFALADSGPACAGAQLTATGGGAIGAAVSDPAQCEALAKTASNGAVCGWNGSSFALFSSSGQAIGDMPGAGARTLAACSDMARSAKGDLVCGWRGDGFAPYKTDGKAATLIGSSKGGSTLGICKARVAGSAGGRICGIDEGELKIYSTADGKLAKEFGIFIDEENCLAAVTKLADPKAADEWMKHIAEIQETKAEPGDPSKPSKAEFGLAGVGYTYTQCHDSTRGYHIVKTDASGNLVCKIDTLYSWGPSVKIDWFKDAPWTGRLKRDGQNAPIFATQSPYATFGYGDFAMRIRLKNDVRYKFISEGYLVNPYAYCDDLSYSQIETTVIARWWKNGVGMTGLDYILCGKGPIHSWSWGTQEHLNEINRDVAWIGEHNYIDYELYVKKGGVDEVLPDNLDGHTFTNAVLQRNLTAHSQNIGNNIYYNPSAGGKSAFYHFKTNWPIYFNPD